MNAYERARAEFEEFAGLGHPDLPRDPINAMQVRLCRWQHALFGFDSKTHDLVLAHGVVEEIGETIAADTRDEALDGLGDVCVYAGQLLIANRMAISPVLELARTAEPTGPGRLCHVVGKRAQRTRGFDVDNLYRLELASQLAACIASAVDVIYQRFPRPNATETYLAIGEQVLRRKRGDVMIPAVTHG